MMAEESAVKVCIRVRPLIEREAATAKEGTKPVLYWKTDEKSVQHCVDDGNATKCFNFDRVFGANESTAQLYHDIAMPLVASAVQGYNGTIFAYGQTSSGKTFTMMGSDGTPGVIPLAMEDVFQKIKMYPKKEFLLRVSYMEIYNETVADLLVDNWKRKPLEVREDSHKTVYVADLTEELVINPAQSLSWIRKGEKNRHYEKTKMNQRSSRSHTIFRMILESREDGDGENADGAITVSHLNLVDLAGSERASQTGAEGARFKEGCNINKSLFTLGQVIKKLSEENQRGFTNYRDSKLTRILQNSLGGNAKTVIICTITPATMDETLSTLQFASTAKYMKNDPHVTEVSDDGALLKRYRNEIVDLKRRLQEVSSVTQTTATEKESLFLLLQEKEQLRIEQTDKIRNLTRLLVTSTSFVASNKMPKRRVTWGGGKLIRPTELSDGHVKPSELSFAEPVTRKMSTLSEQGEYYEEFESRWESPYDSSYCPEMNQNSFSSFGDSSQISDKVSELENRLKAETNQKEEAESLLKAETNQREQVESRLKAETNQKEQVESRLKAETNQKEQAESRLKAETDQKAEALAKAETLHRRVEELDAQLAIEVLQTHGAMEKMVAAENAAVELNLQLKVETQQKQESVVMLELRVADLERQLQEWTDSTSKADEIQKQSDDAMQLFDSLVSNQEAVIAERNQMKQEVDFLKEQAEQLEQEKEELFQELAERRDLEEFNSLEKDQHEQELMMEMSSLKKDLESAEYKCQEFKAKLSLMSEDLKKQSDWVEELQSLKDKDLVQEVSRLRRSLDDAEGLSRDTKKEWAILRSQNISLKERDVEQTANYEKIEAGVSGLHHQVETEKSRYKKMQADLQRELNMAFDENTKLTTLLNGKVPQNLIDSMTLEREVTNLKKELTVCHDKEGELQAQLKELSPLQHLPDKVDNLLKQVYDLTEALCAVESQRDSLLSGQAQSQEESHQLRDALQKLQGELAVAEHKEAHLTQRCADTTEDLDTVRSDLARLDAERAQLLATVQDTMDRLNESDKQQTTLGETLNEMQQLIKDLEEKLVDSEQSKNMEEEICKELQEQVSQLTEELQNARAERDGLLSEKVSSTQSSTEQVDSLLSKVSSLTEETDQLKVDLQESVDMNRELRTTLEENCRQKENIKRLEETLEECHSKIQGLEQDLDGVKEERNELKDDLRDNVDMVSQLTEELQNARAERDCLLSEKVSATQSSTEQVDSLLSKVSSLTEEREQLKVDLQESVDMNLEELRTTLEENCRQKENIKRLEETLEECHSKIQGLEQELDGVKEERNELKDDLRDNMDMAIENQADLMAALKKKEELQNQNQQLSEDLTSLKAERDGLPSSASCTMSTVTCLTEERDQLKEILEGLRQEKNQLRADLEANIETVVETSGDLRTAQEKIKQLESGSCAENVSCLEELQNQNLQLSEELDRVRAERDGLFSNASVTEEVEKLLSTVTCLTEEGDQLKEILEALRQEKNQLRAELEANMEMTIEKQVELRDADEKITLLKEEVDLLRTRSEQQENESCPENVSLLEELKNQNQQLSKELADLRAERDGLLSSTSATMSTVTSLTEERDQLKEMHEGLRQEKIQLGADLEANMETSLSELRAAHDTIERLNEEVDRLNTHAESHAENVSHLEKLKNEKTEKQEELDAAQETIGHLNEEVGHLKTQIEQLENERRVENFSHLAELQNQNQQLSKELDCLRAERDGLLSSEGTTMSTVTSLTEERDQLKEMHEGLRQEKIQLGADLEANMETNQQLSKELDCLRAERDGLLSSASATMSTVTSLTEERDQLKEMHEGLRQEKIQIGADLEANMETNQQLSKELDCLRAERDGLLSSEGTTMSTVTSLTEERDQLKEMHEGLRQEKIQLRADMEANMETSRAELRAAQDTIERLNEEVHLLNTQNKSHADNISHLEELQNKTQQLSEELDRVRTERDGLVSNTKISTEELEKLTSRVTCLTDKRDQLQKELDAAQERTRLLKQEVDVLNSGCKQLEQLQNKIKVLEQELEHVNEERNQLKNDLQENVDKTIQNQLELVNAEEKGRLLDEEVDLLRTRSEQLQNQMEQLSEELDIVKIDKLLSQADLSDANERLTFLMANAARSAVQMPSRLQDSVEQLQNYLHGFQVLKDNLCSSTTTQSQQEAYRVQISLVLNFASLHYPTKEAFVVLSRNVDSILLKKRVLLKSYAQDFMHVFKDLFQKDLDLFEEKRLQDVLMCKAEATLFSVADEDFQELWQQRLTELLDKRHFYLQQIPNVLEKLNLWRELTDKELSDELGETKRFTEQLRALSNNQHLDSTSLDSILSSRVTCRSAGLDDKKRTLEALRGDIRPLFNKVKILRGDAAIQLKQEMSNTATLLKTRGEITPLKTEVGLLKENQQLILQLQQSEKQIEALLGQITQLEQAQVNAMSTHKGVTQLLQTQLQDVYAEVQTLKDKLQLSVKTTEEQQPLAMETKRLKAKLVKMQLELTSQSTDYEGRLQTLNKALDEKAIELRQLKMKLRTAQQEQECSFLQGKELCGKLSKANGATVESSTHLEEVKQLQMKITELESQVSSQQKETKWKGRAVMLNEKTKVSGADKPTPRSPCTPTKRQLPVTFSSSHLNSPKKTLRKIPDSPRATAPAAAKSSSYFDLESEQRSKNQPFQFFDNSSLGSTAAMAEDSISLDPQNLDGGAEKVDEWWPKSPKQEEICKAQ